jgi:hypothetical protein
LLVDIKQKTEQQNPKPTGRAAYSTPKLKVFGSVGELTQAGTAGGAEMGMGMGMGAGAGSRRP